MARTCGSCVYYDGTYCRHNAPYAELSGNPKVIWPQVDPNNDWCAEGWNKTDGSYDLMTPVPTPLTTHIPVTGKKA